MSPLDEPPVDVVWQAPRVKILDNVAKEELPGMYRELALKNPLLARIEGTCRSLGWSDAEIRTAQLVAVVSSNASLQAALNALRAQHPGR